MLGEPTLEKSMETYRSSWIDTFERHPWKAPGSAPVFRYSIQGGLEAFSFMKLYNYQVFLLYCLGYLDFNSINQKDIDLFIYL